MDTCHGRCVDQESQGYLRPADNFVETPTLPRVFDRSSAARAAPPAPRITTVLPVGMKPDEANAALAPWTSVLSPVQLPVASLNGVHGTDRSGGRRIARQKRNGGNFMGIVIEQPAIPIASAFSKKSWTSLAGNFRNT